MKGLLAALALAGMISAASAQTPPGGVGRTQMQADIASNLPDNTAALISPTALRRVLVEITNSTLFSLSNLGDIASTTAALAALNIDGLASLTTNAVVLGASSGAVASAGLMTDGQLLVGQTASVPVPKTLSGSCTLAASGAISCSTSSSTSAVVTANYTIAASDCGNTIQAGTGSGGFFTVTLPSVSGFPSYCDVTVINGDTGRGKGLSGFPTGTFPANTPAILYPLQSVKVSLVNSAWITVKAPGRWLISGGQNVYVDVTNGSDTNDGLVSGAGGAWKHILQAQNFYYGTADCGAQGSVFVNMANGTYNEQINLFSRPVTCLGIDFLGATGSSQANVVWTSGNGLTSLNVVDYAIMLVAGVKFTCVSGSCSPITCQKHAVCDISATGYNVEFGNVGTATDVTCILNAECNVIGGLVFSGNMANAFFSNTGGTMSMAATISVPSPLTFTYFFNVFNSQIQLGTMTFTGSGAGAGSTGQKYIAQANGVMSLGGASNVPGATAGSTATGGQAF